MPKDSVKIQFMAALLAVSLCCANTAFSATQKKGAKPSATEAAIAAVQDDGNYRIGAGDVLHVSVWKENEASAVVIVRPDGRISLPLINEVDVLGKTPMEVQEMVTVRMAPFINTPNVTVTVNEIRSKKVYVIGQVMKPGSIEIRRPTTILQVLTEAGGLQPFAKQKSIYVLRKSAGKQEKLSFNYKDAVKGKLEKNILLEPDDTVVVP